jgi:dolichol kinase
MILRDAGATALCAVLAVALVKVIGYGYENGWYNSKIGRKLNHTLAAPAFILFFPLFSSADGARFFAGLVTFSNILRLYLAGTGQGESSLAKTISRSGDKSEVLGGPFIYVCLFQLFIWFFWRNSMIGVVAMSTMAAGDGMADLVGRKWGSDSKWEFSDGSKSKVGTLAFIVSAFLTSLGLVNWLITTGCLETALAPTDLAARLLVISVVTAFVELVPFGDDNYTVPGTAAILASILLK